MEDLKPIEKLLIDLIKIDSVSGNEQQIGDFICQMLAGFKVTKQPVAKGRFNIIASKGKSDIWIVAHMDTVAGLVPMKITKERIYGRGAVDNKANIAGAIIVAKQLENINLFFTVGEEVDFIGVKSHHIVGKVIVMEPTNLRVKLNQCGLIIADIITKGTQKHSSLYFKDVDNANHLMLKFLNQLLSYQWNGLNIAPIQGGIAPNMISDKCVANISIRPKTTKDYESILKTLDQQDKNIVIDIKNSIPPYTSSLSMKNFDNEPVTFFSELSFFKKGVLFGVGDIHQAHTKNEYIQRSQLRKLTKNLINLINEL